MNLSFDDYLQIDAVNWSTLKYMRLSPLHYLNALKNPRKDTPRLALGRAGHTAVFEPDRFMVDYACFKGGIRRGKKWDEFKKVHEGDTILKKDEYQLCLAMRDAVRGNPAAAAYLSSGDAEHSIRWLDAETDIACKGRLDFWNGERAAIVDLKTTSDVSANRFGQLAARMSYHMQLAWYAEGVKRSLGVTPHVILIAVEAAPPHDVAVYRMDEDALYAGWEEVQRLLSLVKQCRESKRWPGRYQEEQTLRLPAWIWDDDEDTNVSGLDLDWSSANNAQGG